MKMQGRARRGLPGDCSRRAQSADTDRWRAAWRLPTVFLMMLAYATVLHAQDSLPASTSTFSIHGTVLDYLEKPAADAAVKLEKKDGSPVAEVLSNATGAFEFRNLETGTYVLSAHRHNLRSSTLTLVASALRGDPVIKLVLNESETYASSKHPSTANPADSMEFADAPTFTVAGVTDWTAAGGHGSDAVLRTSEAVTRAALVPESKRESTADASQNHAEFAQREKELLSRIQANPESPEANHELGKLYLESGRSRESLVFLEKAFNLEPANREFEYGLAQAYIKIGDLKTAKGHVQTMLSAKATADLYRMDGEIDEGLADPLSAVHEFELAARMDPSEQNTFAWGSELLLHRAVWQAKDVFSKGVRDYPKSARMMTALGAALFAGALYDEAAQRLCEASDLDPADREPYILMGKILVAAPGPLPCVHERLARFVKLRPNDPLANYYYGMAIWKEKRTSLDASSALQIRTLLAKAVELDEKCGDALLQLGNLDFARNDYSGAVWFFTRAIAANPQLIEAHYRLGMAYDRMGEKAKASEEFQLHDTLKKQQAAIVEQQRREVKQFQIVTADQTNGPKNP